MAQKDKDNIRYTPLPDATPESELDALAAVYAFVLDCHASRGVAGCVGDRNEVKEDKDVDPKGRVP
jgi:hypothetical protein